MRLEQLTYLVSAAKAGSISAAAQRLNVSRQAVSSALGSLESELVFLFLKMETGIEANVSGKGDTRESGGCPEAVEEREPREGWMGREIFQYAPRRCFLFI